MFAAVLLTGFATVLGVAGFASAQGGNDAAGARQPGGDATVPPSVLAGGPVVDTTRARVTSTSPAAGTITLTFDDGPDPVWTPQVLAVLARYHVPATFFVVGSNVARHPELVRAIRAAGGELGVHTFSHPDLSVAPRWRVDRELAETQLALAGSAGVTSNLLRPPYSASAAAIDDLGWTTVSAAGQDGYVCVFTTADSEDWQRPGVAAILRNATPPAGGQTGTILLMHDAGGDRSETVAALNTYIPAMLAKGYRFTTVTAGLGRPSANLPATDHDRRMGAILITTLAVATAVVTSLDQLVLVVGILVVLRLLFMVVLARRHARRRSDPAWTWGIPVDWPVSVIVPAYDEAKNIEATVRSLLANDHPMEVIVVDDGSTDGTPELVESLHLPGVRVLRQANAGKPAALNTGIRAARHELLIMIDSDTIFEPDTVALLVAPFADPSVGAVAGNVKIANRDDLLGRLQHIEYVVGFAIDRRVQDVLGSIATIPGAAGAFRRRALLDVGGLSPDTLAEDTDLTIALGRAGWRVVFEDRARAWTEAPATVAQLWRQRYRWSYGTMQAIWKHRGSMTAGGTAGRVGRRGLAHIAAFHILLPLTAPLVDVFTVYGILFQDPATTLLLWLGMLLVQLAGACYAFRLDGEDRGALWVLPLQQILYRQLMYLVLVQSLISAAAGVRVRWQRMQRVGVLGALLPGLAPAAAAVPAPRPARRAPHSEPPRPLRPGPRPPDPARGATRDRWLDVLAVAAIGALVAHATVPTLWAAGVFPSLGVLCALGGTLMARSVRDTPAVDVIGHRLRRLLLPLWAFGAVLVPLMLLRGWTGSTGTGTLYWTNLVFWVLPFLDPPASTWATDLTGGVDLVHVGLWLVLLTPLLLRAFRLRPLVSVLVPIAVLAMDAALGRPLADMGGLAPTAVELATFAPCWMLGFAHRDGVLRRAHPGLVTAIAAVAVVTGAMWTQGHPSTTDGADPLAVPFGEALVAAGTVLVLLRFEPALGWLRRVPGVDRATAAVTGRAVTICLILPVATALGGESGPGVVPALTALGVLAFGWIEDLAARRPPRLLPASTPAARPRHQTADPHPATRHRSGRHG